MPATIVTAQPNRPAPFTSSYLVAITWPMVSVEFAMMLLNLNRAAVLQLLDEGQLLYAWDIRAHNACRSFLRVYSQSIVDYQSKTPDSAGSHTAVIESILPVMRGNPSTPALCRVLGCDEKHVNKLGNENLIRFSRRGRRGKGHASIFSCNSIASFLEERRYPWN
ncbi:MAG: hypothetical protein JWR26_4846 [Pedosphaera sp.]|nr:hypothetical protein [Pedosphaera sp.]